MKGILLGLLFLLNIDRACAQEDFGASFIQENYADSVLHLLPTVTNDTTKVILLDALGGYYLFVRQDSSGPFR